MHNAIITASGQTGPATTHAERLFERLLEAAPDAIVIIDDNGRIVLVNSQTEALFGYPRAELVGQSIEILVPERHRGRHPDHRRAYLSSPKVRPMGSGLDLRGRRKDGSEFPVEISLSPLQTEEGVLLSSAIRDVSDRRRMEAALASANRELESFSYAVAHDLRAPLRGMSGFARILRDEHAGTLDADGLDCLSEIERGAASMSALIDALLSLSRVTRTELRPESVDLSEIARSVVAALQIAEPAHRVDVSIAEGLQAQADPRLACALLENLVGNAWKFSAKVPAPRIEIGAAEPGVFFVRDNGAGFDMAYAGKLFGAFQRLHGVTEFPGTGIGLATAQRIVHRHGGRIWADGSVGTGATFHFTLPTEPVGETT